MNPPANWYPDPTGRHGQRYWDGEQWTEHVFTDGVQDVDPLEQATGAADQAITDRATTDEAVADQAGEATSDEAVADQTGEAGESGAASGLFEDAGGQDVWTPQDEGGEEDAPAVAPDMQAEDVVASLDEVGDAPPADDATADGADAPPSGDMSDAFVLAPETASRIVKRRAADAGDDSQPADVAEADEAVGLDTGAIDAPPPTAAAPPSPAEPPTPGGSAPSGDLGITGDLLGGAFAERSGAGPVALQNSRLLRCAVTPADAVVARQGTMVAYQGDVSFDRQGAGGVTRAIKRAATGEGLAMMRAEGSGDVFFADGAQHVFLLQLAGGPGLSVNGRNVLAFSAALEWDIQRVKGASLLAGGLFNTTFTGTGWVALVSDGEPVVLHTDEAPTHVDVNALVAWSAGLSTEIVSSVSAKALVGLGSGEAFQMAFDGPGIVIVQPSEGPLGGAAAT